MSICLQINGIISEVQLDLRPIIEKIPFLVLTFGKFLEALGSGIGIGSVVCHLFSFSNDVCYHTISKKA